MPKIKRYDRLLPNDELGADAELTIDGACWDVGDMTLREMNISHEHMIRTAKKVVLSSSEIGNWKYNKDRRTWDKEG